MGQKPWLISGPSTLGAGCCAHLTDGRQAAPQIGLQQQRRRAAAAALLLLPARQQRLGAGRLGCPAGGVHSQHFSRQLGSCRLGWLRCLCLLPLGLCPRIRCPLLCLHARLRFHGWLLRL